MLSTAKPISFAEIFFTVYSSQNTNWSVISFHYLLAVLASSIKYVTKEENSGYQACLGCKLDILQNCSFNVDNSD